MPSAFQKIPAKKKLSGLLFPKYSLTLDQVNHNAAYRAWLNAQTAPVFPGRPEFEQYLFETFVKSAAITYAEFGVHTGGSMSRWVERSRNPDSRFHGFDSFIGLPEDWTATVTKSFFDLGGKEPRFPDSRVKLHKGWFQETVPGFVKEYASDKPLVIHVDCDLYSSTLYALASLNPFIKAGTLIIFDEFHSPLHEFRAWNDYCRAFMRKGSAVAMTASYGEQTAFVVE
jgi:hypothetical protein